MYLGRIVELAPREAIWTRPLHPYTRALVAAVPSPDPDAADSRRQHVILQGDLPSPLDPPAGCAFHTRCPIVTALCRRERPPLEVKDGAPGRLVACHHAMIAAENAPRMGGPSA
jgi:oligopeptide/dipeptide ABC transporter ATP-binding protein